jgi:hypothetical protein
MTLDDPATIAEARAVFDRYEAALMANQNEILDEIFWERRPHRPLRHHRDPLRARRHPRLRASVKSYAQRVQKRVHITAFGPDFACTHLEYERVGTGLIGRETKIMVRLPEIGWRVVSAHVSLLAGTDPGRA